MWPASLLAAALIAQSPPTGVASPAPSPVLAVVVAKDSPLQDLSLADLRRLFLAEPMTDAAGTRLVPVNQPTGTGERTAFDRAVLGMSPDEVGRFWIDRKIRGQGAVPRAVSALLVQRLCARLPGTVAYVRSDRLEPGVRALRIGGRLPGQPGYPLPAPEDRRP